MPSFYRINPVVDGNAVAVFGKVPDYVELNFGNGTIPATANILSSWNLGPNGVYPLVIQQVEQLATIEILGTIQANCVLLSAGGGNANIGVRMFTTGVNAANAAELQTAIQALGVVGTGNGSTLAPWSNVNLAGVTVSAVTVGVPANGNSGGQFAAGFTF